MIKPILYERIEQKNEIEREMFSKLSKDEVKAIKRSWRLLLKKIKQGSSKQKSAQKGK